MKKTTQQKLRERGFAPFKSRITNEDFAPFKKTAVTWAQKMDKPFTCDTLEGDNIKGKAGDYLCIGEKGEIWPVDAEIFEKTYTSTNTDETSDAEIVMDANGKVKVVSNGKTIGAQG